MNEDGLSDYRDSGRDLKIAVALTLIITALSISITMMFPKIIHDFILVYWWIILIIAIFSIGPIIGITTDPSGREEYMYGRHDYQRYYPELRALIFNIIAILSYLPGLYLLSLGFMVRSAFDPNRVSIIVGGIILVIISALCIDGIYAIRRGYKI